jgi:CO/xanthine dehydrogenase Mo-binding subunit
VHRDGSFIAVLAQEEAQAMAAITRADQVVRWDIPQSGLNDPIALLSCAGPNEIMVEEGVLPGGNRKIVAEIERPFLAHASIGTCCALAKFQSEKLQVWSHTQGPFQLRMALAEALGVAVDQIDVMHRPGAGCYGHNGADDVAFEAALLAMAYPDRPIRLSWRREDEMTRGPLSSAMRSRAEIILGDDGRIAGMSVDILSGPHQRRPGPGRPSFAAGPLLESPVPFAPATEPPATNGGGSDRNAVPPYNCGALRISRRVAYDMPLRTSAMRSLGAYANVAAIELGMDVAAENVDVDPVSFRLDHLDDMRAQAVIKRVVQMSGFSSETDGTTAMGLGFSRYKNKAGYCAAVIEVNATDRLVVPRLWVAADVGEAIDPDGVLVQIEGGAIQTLSWSLKEEVPIVNGAADLLDWEHYPILRFSELPEITVELIGPQEAPPLGAGEITQGPVAGALACAVRRLFRFDKIRMPLTADGIAKMLLT